MRPLEPRIREAKTVDEVDQLSALAEREGHSFVSRLTTEWQTRSNRFDAPGEALFVAEVEGEVVGVCGLNIDPYADSPHIARVRHLYVAPAIRRHGVGSALLETVARQARSAGFERLRTRTYGEAASEFYRVHGFRRTGGPTWTHELDLVSN
jgi:GNAT superfamily N-acetyltransferase